MQGYWIPTNTVTGEVGASSNDAESVTAWLAERVSMGDKTGVLAVQRYAVTDDPLAPGIVTRTADISYDDWIAENPLPVPDEEPPEDVAENNEVP